MLSLFECVRTEIEDQGKVATGDKSAMRHDADETGVSNILVDGDAGDVDELSDALLEAGR